MTELFRKSFKIPVLAFAVLPLLGACSSAPQAQRVETPVVASAAPPAASAAPAPAPALVPIPEDVVEVTLAPPSPPK